VRLDGGSYRYRYEQPPHDASEEVKAATARRNVSASIEMDPLRFGMGPSAPELRARVLAAGAASNGRAEVV
jgi:hypothetical protein